MNMNSEMKYVRLGSLPVEPILAVSKEVYTWPKTIRPRRTLFGSYVGELVLTSRLSGRNVRQHYPG